MKNMLIFQFICWYFIPTIAFAQVDDLGKETIEPLRFPKFTVGGEYAIFRNFRAFNGSNLKQSLDNAFSVNLHAEAGLIKYLNAGLSISFTTSKRFLESSNIFRMGFFIKPYIPIGSRVSFFSRVGLGPSLSFGTEAMGYQRFGPFSQSNKPEGYDEFTNTYGLTSYWPLAAGFNGSAAFGFEAFFTPRVGMAVEAGIRADMLWAKIARYGLSEKPNYSMKSGKPPPNWFHYFIYDIPIMLNVHIIL